MILITKKKKRILGEIFMMHSWHDDLCVFNDVILILFLAISLI